MNPIDHHAFAQRQYERDRANVSRIIDLWPIKRAKMAVSSLSFLRGSAPLFFELLRAEKNLADGPDGVGWLAGDLHLENFGAYRPEQGNVPEPGAELSAYSLSKQGNMNAVFDLNDFDEAFIGPWTIDLVRLTTSLILAGRERGTTGLTSLELGARVIEGYCGRSFGTSTGDYVVPEPVRTLVAAAGARKQHELIDQRTEIVRGRRRFKRNDLYRDLPAKWMSELAKALALYAHQVDDEWRPTAEQLEVVDATFRVAGNGSLGALRIAVLVRGSADSGKGEGAGTWVLDIKEEGSPAGESFGTKPDVPAAKRVERAIRECVAAPPRRLGTTIVDGKSMLVRRLSPQEDRLDFADVRGQDLESLSDYLGQLAAAAHRRGATAPPKTAWTKGDKRDLLERAVTIASIHEAAYLAYCKLVRDNMT